MTPAQPTFSTGFVSGAREWVSKHPLATIVLTALVVRIALAPLWANLPNGLTDEGFWKHWMEQIHNEGVLNIFRTTKTDYVGYHWVLWLMTLVYEVMGGSYNPNALSLHLLVKVPSIIFDVALILTVYWATTRLLESAGEQDLGRLRRFPLVAALIVAVHPAVLYDSAVWAQTDSAITAAMLGALVLASIRRPFAAGAVLALGLAVKPHPIIVGPVLILLLWRAGGVRSLLRAAAGGLLVSAIVLGPWIVHGDGGRIVDVYQFLFTEPRERLSELAWNVWWVFDYRGDPRPGTEIVGGIPLTFQRAGLLLGMLATALAMLYAWRRPGLHASLVAAAYIAFAFYEFPVGSHERYLYPFFGLILPVVVVASAWRWRYLYAALSTTFFLNLVTVAPPLRQWMDRWVYGEFGVYVSLLNTTLFVLCTAMIIVELRLPRPRRPAGAGLELAAG